MKAKASIKSFTALLLLTFALLAPFFVMGQPVEANHGYSRGQCYDNEGPGANGQPGDGLQECLEHADGWEVQVASISVLCDQQPYTIGQLERSGRNVYLTCAGEGNNLREYDPSPADFLSPTPTNLITVYADCRTNTDPPVFSGVLNSNRDPNGAYGEKSYFIIGGCDDNADTIDYDTSLSDLQVVSEMQTKPIEEPESNDSGSGSSGGTEGEGANAVEQIPPCAESDIDGADNNTCIDSFSRCPAGSVFFNRDSDRYEDAEGRYGVPSSQRTEAGNLECFLLDPDSGNTDLVDNPIVIFLGRLIQFISAGVGIILVGITLVAGIRYSLAKGNPQESAAAKSMLEKVAIGVALYVFAFALINFLIPGGLLQ